MFVCEKCEATTTSVIYKDAVRMCHPCYDDMKGAKKGLAPSVHGDECDVWIKHGVCNEDGSPKRYRSKSEIRQAAYEKGLFQGGDTPKVNPRLQEASARKRENR